jgi:hypothetical protein
MTDQVAALHLQVDGGADADDEEVAELTQALRQELLQLDVEAVEPAVGGEVPPGAKAVEALAVGGLIVSLVKSAGMLGAVVDTVQSWLARLGSRSVKLELDGDVLEVTGISAQQQGDLIRTWVERHAAAQPPRG